jgi:hypothetical protein
MSWPSTPSTRVIVTCLIVPIVLMQLLSCPPVIVLTHRVAIVLTLIVEPSYCVYCLVHHYCIVTLLSLLRTALDWTTVRGGNFRPVSGSWSFESPAKPSKFRRECGGNTLILRFLDFGRLFQIPG